MLVHQVMVRDVQVIAPDAGVDEAARMMADLDIGALPVSEGGALRGILTDRDVLIRVVAQCRDPRRTPVADVMSSTLFTCDPADTVDDAALAMERHQVRRMPVVDAEGRMIGLVTLSDLQREGARRGAREPQRS
jgi:CBS domain-containing protein